MVHVRQFVGMAFWQVVRNVMMAIIMGMMDVLPYVWISIVMLTVVVVVGFFLWLMGSVRHYVGIGLQEDLSHVTMGIQTTLTVVHHNAESKVAT